MTQTTFRNRPIITAALLAFTLLAAGCGSDKVSRTTTTESTTAVAPAPVTSSTTTTTSRQTQP